MSSRLARWGTALLRYGVDGVVVEALLLLLLGGGKCVRSVCEAQLPVVMVVISLPTSSTMISSSKMS